VRIQKLLVSGVQLAGFLHGEKAYFASEFVVLKMPGQPYGFAGRERGPYPMTFKKRLI